MSSLNPIEWFEARLIITIFIEITIKVGFDTPFGFVEVWSLGKRFSEVLFDKKYTPTPFDVIGEVDKAGSLGVTLAGGDFENPISCESREITEGGETM